MKTTRYLAALAGVALTLLTVKNVQSLNAPTVIRIAIPGVGIGNRPVVGGEALSTTHIKGLLEEEFRKRTASRSSGASCAARGRPSTSCGPMG